MIGIDERAKDVTPDGLAGYGIGARHATTTVRVLPLVDVQAFELFLPGWAQILRRGTNTATSNRGIALDHKEGP